MWNVMNRLAQFVNRIHVDPRLNVLFYQVGKQLVSALKAWVEIHRQVLVVMDMSVA